MQRLHGVLDKRLGEARYLGGDLSIADTGNFPWIHAGRSFLGLDLAPYANLTRWLDELAARPAFGKAMGMKP